MGKVAYTRLKDATYHETLMRRVSHTSTLPKPIYNCRPVSKLPRTAESATAGSTQIGPLISGAGTQGSEDWDMENRGRQHWSDHDIDVYSCLCGFNAPGHTGDDGQPRSQEMIDHITSGRGKPECHVNGLFDPVVPYCNDCGARCLGPQVSRRRRRHDIVNRQLTPRWPLQEEHACVLSLDHSRRIKLVLDHLDPSPGALCDNSVLPLVQGGTHLGRITPNPYAYPVGEVHSVRDVNSTKLVPDSGAYPGGQILHTRDVDFTKLVPSLSAAIPDMAQASELWDYIDWQVYEQLKTGLITVGAARFYLR